MKCPVCGMETATMYAHCDNCGIRMCMACYGKNVSRCSSCNGIMTVKKN